jgi:hypothetical protein
MLTSNIIMFSVRRPPSRFPTALSPFAAPSVRRQPSRFATAISPFAAPSVRRQPSRFPTALSPFAAPSVRRQPSRFATALSPIAARTVRRPHATLFLQKLGGRRMEVLALGKYSETNTAKFMIASNHPNATATYTLHFKRDPMRPVQFTRILTTGSNGMYVVRRNGISLGVFRFLKVE